MHSYIPLLACCATVVAAQLRILPVGDSITYGCGDSCAYSPGDSCTLNSTLECSGSNNTCYGGYRTRLQRLLADSGVTAEMVGPQSNCAANVTRMACRNAGFSGASIGPTKNGWDLMTLYAEWATPFADADLVLLLIGTNDLWSGDSSTTVLRNYAALLARMNSTFAPSTSILVGSILDMTTITWPPDIHEEWSATNTGLKALVDSLVPVQEPQSFGRSRFEFIDLAVETGLCPETPRNNSLCCRAYNVHPSDSGYDRLAAAWMHAIQP